MKFHRRRKSFMTLLETLIAISLLSILLVFVFGFFRELAEITRLTEHSQKQSFQMRYLESRLGFIFERVVNENESSRNFFFYMQPPNRNISSSPSLILTFYNDVRLDPSFSGDVLGRLYVDGDKRLCLAMWPLHVSDPHQYLQQEVLMDHVIDVSYSFYAPPERVKDGKEIVSGEKIDSEKKMPERDHWHEEWFLTYDQMPSIIKMTINIEDHFEKKKEASDKDNVKKHVLYFVLPSSQNYVYYPPGELSA